MTLTHTDDQQEEVNRRASGSAKLYKAMLDIHPTFPIVHLSLDPPQLQFVPQPL